ncbi:MAG: serpin family protein [Myxococcales bacterium]|nr:serpin family protein [Myxococcales bacterium]
MRTLLQAGLVVALALGCEARPAPTPGATSRTPATSTASGRTGSHAPAPATASATSTSPVGPATSSPEAKKAAAGSNAFGVDLYRKLRDRPGNLAVSPASLSMALAMTWGGAVGDTAAEMQKVMHFEGSATEVATGAGKLAAELQDPSRQVTFQIANRLFGEKSYAFEQPFLDATKRAFGAGLEAVDFKTGFEAARGTINTWVADHTEQRIQNLIPSGGLTDLTRLVLVNATYFLGVWQHEFEKERTHDAAFSTSKTATVEVPTMHQTASLKLAARDGMKMLELPYRGGAMSLLLVLPDAVDGLGALEAGLTLARLEGWAAGLEVQSVVVALPKFTIEPAEALALAPILQDLGMKLAFGDKADFTKIANPPAKDQQLRITDVFHKAFVKVDEKGTEAAAASAVVMGEKRAGQPQEPQRFVADHPFLYLLRDNPSGLFVFMGRVVDPSAK